MPWSAARNRLLARYSAGLDSSSSRSAASGRPAIIGLVEMNFLPLLFDGLSEEPPGSSDGGSEPDPGVVGSGSPPGGGGSVGAGTVGRGSGVVSVGVDVGSGSGASSVGTGMGSGLAVAGPVVPTITAADSTTAMPVRARNARMTSPLPVWLTGKRAGDPFGHAPAAPRATLGGI